MPKADTARAQASNKAKRGDVQAKEDAVVVAGTIEAPQDGVAFSAASARAKLERSLERLPKAVQVYEILRSAIISMDLPPDAVLPEKAICSELGLSRTPYREAVLQLASEDLVTDMPGEGTFVNRIRLRDVLEGHLVRDTLEVRLSRLAARNFRPEHESEFEVALFRQKGAAARGNFDEFFSLDNAFHRMVCDLSGFTNGWRTIHLATGQLDRVRRLAFPVENNMDEVLQEHGAMFSALKAKNEKATEHALQVQLDSIYDTIKLLQMRTPDLIDSDEFEVTMRIR